ncbi:hypothetical protein VN12_21850 [Pirellula sp. SH-Sr6A]|uniref:hypothetical protein n=1 Tax=Pirellula sp. SH-Sr6A TaxID=1632865 RepID=UPI00078E812A|nr:hypothetical protein [Pirellula sp. SH-Sr6A]AMV34786.1 hypothetical protein VN12_21850 [Pirellula sp. SH-Sr6A]
MCISLSGCAIVLAPPGALAPNSTLGNSAPSSTHSISCSCADRSPLLADNGWEDCHSLSNDLEPVRPELIPSRWKDAGLLARARLSDWKDRCRARHEVSCEACKAWFQSKVKPPEEPPWPKFHPVPSAPAFTPREDEVEAVAPSQSHQAAW